jgi:hypothetical protein
LSESKLWKKLKLKTKGWHIERVEDYLTDGRPDVEYCVDGVAGWVELKYMKKWPVRPTTPLRMAHLTVSQENWHFHYHRHGGRSYFLIQVDDDYLLHKGEISREINNQTQKWHFANCLAHCKGKLMASLLLFLRP